MDTPQIHAAARARGVTEQALDAVTATVQAHFAGRTPSPAELDAYIVSRPVWEKIGMDKATFDGMPVTWRLGQGEAYQLLVPRRPEHRLWTAEERKALQGKSLTDRLTAGHAGPPQDQGKG